MEYVLKLKATQEFKYVAAGSWCEIVSEFKVSSFLLSFSYVTVANITRRFKNRTNKNPLTFATKSKQALSIRMGLHS